MEVELVALTTAREPSLTMLEVQESCRRVGFTLVRWLNCLGSSREVKAQQHPCIITFTLRQDAVDITPDEELAMLRVVLSSCSLLRYIFKPAIALVTMATRDQLAPLLAQVHGPVDVVLVGRKLSSQKKTAIINKLLGAEFSSSVQPGDAAWFVIGDLRGSTQKDEQQCEYIVAQLLCVGADRYMKHGASLVPRRQSLTGGAFTTTRLDYPRCYLACSAAGVKRGSLVLDPFAGSCAIAEAAQMFGAECLCSDLDQAAFPAIHCVSDARSSPWREHCFDAIICDPPYGLRTGLLNLDAKRRKADIIGEGAVESVDGANKGEQIVTGDRCVHCGYRASSCVCMLKCTVALASHLLVRGGRLVMWWFEVMEREVTVRDQLDAMTASEDTSLNAMQVIGLGYDDHGLGAQRKSNSSTATKRLASEGDTGGGDRDGDGYPAGSGWRRCMIVMEKKQSGPSCEVETQGARTLCAESLLLGLGGGDQPHTVISTSSSEASTDGVLRDGENRTDSVIRKAIERTNAAALLLAATWRGGWYHNIRFNCNKVLIDHLCILLVYRRQDCSRNTDIS